MSREKQKKHPLQVLQEHEAQKTRTEVLAEYNAERARGIVHTPEWDERMAVLQERFDARIAEEAQWKAEEHTTVSRRRVNLPS